jgi:hypothetical protein
MKKLIVAAAAVALFALSVPTASAAGCQGVACQNPGQSAAGAFARFFGKQPLPAFQAAPWYLYWPYNAHFQTPAPRMGQYYAPPTGPIANPYFPATPGYPH